jgi:hypothetical protein
MGYLNGGFPYLPLYLKISNVIAGFEGLKQSLSLNTSAGCKPKRGTTQYLICSQLLNCGNLFTAEILSRVFRKNP